jgi:DNA polymerase
MRGRIEIIHPAGDSVRDKLNNLFRLAKKCDVCKGLGTLRDQLVFAAGDPGSDLMFVGEAPGGEEEEQKKPFVGPAGKKLDQIIQAMGLSREKVYISNIVKYRPKIGDGRFQGAKNRRPTPDEIAASVKFVRSEIEVIKPKVIVALGGTAAEGLLEQSGSVSSMRGRFFELDGIPVAVTYHPSYLLRLESDTDQERARQEKRKVWEDALSVMEKLNMPISEKQRGFFSN